MNRNELYYRKVIGAIGCTMLLFLLLLNLFGIGIVFVSTVLSFVFFDAPVICDVIYQIFYAVCYLLSFMLPVLLLKKLIGKAGYVYQPMQSPFRMSPWIFLMIPATITVIFAASYLNASMVNIFGYSEFTSDVLLGTETEKPTAYQWVLEFIVICVVPGLCEEFLFRGAIQTNCRPFGSSNAILISSLLFALMHQNAGQIFYAFVAGIFLGVVYEKTGSIWNCTILHILNNFASTFEDMIFYKLESVFESTVYMTLFEILLSVVGLISLAILIGVFFSKKQSFRDGVFGKDLPMSDAYAVAPVSAKRAVGLFLTPSMVIFLVLCLIQILFLILMAMVYGYVGM